MQIFLMFEGMENLVPAETRAPVQRDQAGDPRYYRCDAGKTVARAGAGRGYQKESIHPGPAQGRIFAHAAREEHHPAPQCPLRLGHRAHEDPDD